MRIGIQLPSFSYPTGSDTATTFARIAREADEVGLHSLWVMDHFFSARCTGTLGF